MEIGIFEIEKVYWFYIDKKLNNMNFRDIFQYIITLKELFNM